MSCLGHGSTWKNRLELTAERSLSVSVVADKAQTDSDLSSRLVSAPQVYNVSTFVAMRRLRRLGIEFETGKFEIMPGEK